MSTTEKIRIDKYLWAIRVFKTRSQASDACEAGKVKWNGNSVKASKSVGLGEEYDIRTDVRKWKIRVTGLLAQRVQFSEAVKYYVDITPEEDQLANKQVATSFFTGKRLSKVGRPTKKERRDLDNFMDI